MELKSPVSRYIFINSFEKLQLQWWEVSPRFQQGYVGLVLGAGHGALWVEASVSLFKKWFQEKCMAGTYVFSEYCESCLVSISISPNRPQHVVAPILPACLLLANFAALLEATALDTQNLSPVETAFRRCKSSIELKVSEDLDVVQTVSLCSLKSSFNHIRSSRSLLLFV